MAGFGKMAIIGEYFGISIVNILWYRSVDWLPFGGNPFNDMVHAMNSVAGHLLPTWKAALPNDYTWLRMEGVGYADDFTVATPAPVIVTIEQAATGGASVTSGAVLTADIKFVLGAQHQINGSGHSKRNRGYIALSPIQEANVDNFGHLLTSWVTGPLAALAGALNDTVADIGGLTSLIPIRIHQKKVNKSIVWRTYSDLTGYSLPRVPGVRKSRRPAA